MNMENNKQNSYSKNTPIFYGFRKAFLKNDQIPVPARFLLVLLMSFKGKNEYCWVSQGKLAKIMCSHRDTVRKNLRILQKNGYLKIKMQGIGRSLNYAPSYMPIYVGLRGKTLRPDENERQRPAGFPRLLSINSGNNKGGLGHV